MTSERERLLEAVAEAAEAALVRWDTLAARRVMRARIDALRAHDAAPQVVEETVEVRALIYMPSGSDRPIVREEGWPGELSAVAFPHIATITARVPLPVVPVIVATVEEVKR